MSSSLSNSSAELDAVIAQLFVYPVKSCGPLAVDSAVLTDQGLEFDRAWMVVDAQGEFYSQREFPRLALVQPQLRQSDLVLRAPGMLALHLSLNGVESAARVSLWGEDLDAWDMGPLAAQWFSDFLGAPARLVRFDPEVERASSRQWTGGETALNQFSDGFPLMVISQPSLDELNRRLQAQGQASVPMAKTGWTCCTSKPQTNWCSCAPLSPARAARSSTSTPSLPSAALRSWTCCTLTDKTPESTVRSALA
jgi:hypothetical protein